MDNFEEWWKVNGANYDYVLPASRDAFEAGQQSRQAEFDSMNKALLKQTQLLAMKQAEINQLQSQINEMAEVGLNQESAIREKDKRIRNAVALLNEIHKRSLDNPEVWDLVDDVWEALRGKDQYTEHRTKAEEQIKKGARLTKHQIDLGENNANS